MFFGFIGYLGFRARREHFRPLILPGSCRVFRIYRVVRVCRVLGLKGFIGCRVFWIYRVFGFIGT